MKKIKIIGLAFFVGLAINCSLPDGIDQDTSFVETITTENVAALFNISDDNSGNVTITPTGEGVSMYTVNFGDGSGSDASAALQPGSNIVHSYAEGDYTVEIIAENIGGGQTANTFPLTVTYRAPENISVNPSVNGYDLSVSAEADYANGFMVYFGDIENEEGTPLGVGETLPPHTYTEAGIYDVRVVALSGGAATSETIVPVTINDPFKLPITFDEEWVNYFFGTFDDIGQQAFETVENPDKSGMNTSDLVGLFTNGHAPWSGTYSPLNSPINFSEGQVITMMVYTADPANIGKEINMELEWPDGASEGQPYGAIVKTPITKAGEWELLTFDFSGIESIPDDAKFNQLVFRFNDSAEGTMEEIYFDDITLTN
ncbi:PKD domain-containing protein [Christiangramia echinicola]|uniref:PKD/Chitinase domain-containing protein n=1 Tax=Christiangramia echinicola TaxID=279359 RepID=A0A1H1MKR7_9FLAO|nr:PKD domain-containing protein [Christiangramia echinicola]SDR87267.1 hypothetical protein SAMN04488552_1346 [Christiangramia echinicola]